MSKSGEEVGPKFVKLLDGSCVLRPYMFYQVFRRVRRVFSFLRVEDREEVKIEKGKGGISNPGHCAPIS